MQHVLLLIGRVVAGVAGGLLIYSAFFLQENEEGQLQDTLEAVWVRMKDLEQKAISREAAFLKIVAGITTKGFDKLFGDRLFGPKAFAASLSYSFAAILISFGVTLPFASFDASATRDALLYDGLALFFLVIGSLGPVIHRQSIKFVWLFLVIFFVLQVVLWVGELFSEFSISLPAAVIADFLFIAVSRVTLRRAAKSNSLLAILSYSISSGALASLLFFLPLRLAFVFGSESNFLGAFPEPRWELLGLANLFNALVSLVWVIVALAILIHRILWFSLLRPLYALDRYNVFIKQKKLVFFAGVALIGVALPFVGTVLDKAVKAVHG